MVNKKHCHYKDLAMKRFLRNPKNAVDCVHYLLPEFQDITEKDIRILDTEELNGTHRIRDVIYQIQKDTFCLIYAMEPQSYQNDKVLIRMMQSDASRIEELYDKQTAGMYGDKIPQIITAVLWLDNAPWTYARALRDITNVVCERYFNDYRLVIIEPDKMDMEAFFSSVKHTDFESVLAFIRASNDDTMMKRILSDSHTVQNLGKETVQAISAVTQAPIEKYIEEKGEATMETCWNRLIEEQRSIGVAKGLEQGIAQGMAEGREEGLRMGRESGKKEQKLEICMNMLRKNLSIDLIQACTGLSEEEISSVRESMQG